MDCFNGKEFVILVILNIFIATTNSAPVSDANITNTGDLNGKVLMELGKKLNLPKLQMIGMTIENTEKEIDTKIDEKVEAKTEEKLETKIDEKLETKIDEKLETKIDEKLEEKICELHPCSEWTDWSVCTARVGPFGSKFRTRHCSFNRTTCEIDSESMPDKDKVEKEFGICIHTYEDCPDGYNQTKNGFCLKFNANRKMSQDEAEKQCQKDGGHLVNIDSELKLEDVSSVVKGFILDRGIWIDGHRKDVSSPWKYSYGSQKGFFKWYSKDPSNKSNELCLLVALFSDGLKWLDYSCNNKWHAICEITNTM